MDSNKILDNILNYIKQNIDQVTIEQPDEKTFVIKTKNGNLTYVKNKYHKITLSLAKSEDNTVLTPDLNGIDKFFKIFDEIKTSKESVNSVDSELNEVDDELASEPEAQIDLDSDPVEPDQNEKVIVQVSKELAGLLYNILTDTEVNENIEFDTEEEEKEFTDFISSIDINQDTEDSKDI